METKDLNRLKVVLAEKKRTNNAQPTLEKLVDIARCLDVTVNDLVRM